LGNSFYENGVTAVIISNEKFDIHGWVLVRKFGLDTICFIPSSTWILAGLVNQ